MLRSATAIDAVNKVKDSLGMPVSIQGAFQGTAAAFENSLANEPMLILAALVTVYLVLGVLYESYIHPITILSTLPSAGVGALLALFITGNDFSVIALIGIVLLIGIVKKNAIMMIDFALEAERVRAMSPLDSIYQASLLALSADHDDDDGGAAGRVAAGAGSRHGLGIAAASGHHDCGRIDLEPVADALYDAGDLFVLRPVGKPFLEGTAKGEDKPRAKPCVVQFLWGQAFGPAAGLPPGALDHGNSSGELARPALTGFHSMYLRTARAFFDHFGRGDRSFRPARRGRSYSPSIPIASWPV